MEKEKVILALETCIGGQCKDCPFKNGHLNFPTCVINLMKESLKLIKEFDKQTKRKEQNNKYSFLPEDLW